MRGSWRPNKDRNILTPQLFWLSQPFFPVLLGCSTGGQGAQPLLGHGSHSSIFSPTDLDFLSLGLYNNLIHTYFSRASQFALNSTLWQSRLSPDIFDRMHLLFTQVHLFFWQLGRGQYATEPQHVLPLRVRVDLGVIEMKWYSLLPQIFWTRALPSDTG